MKAVTKTLDANSHIFRHDVTIEAESRILSQLLRPDMKVLDVGCAATGRSAILLKTFGCEVHSVEINAEAILEFGGSRESAAIMLAAADVCQLPYQDDSFDLVLVAFHGMDYLLDGEMRRLAFREMHRVTREGGALVFNGFNRVGILLNPELLRSAHYRRLWLRHVGRGYPFTKTLVDDNNLRLHQGTPASVIEEVQSAAAFNFQYATNKSCTTRNLALVTLFASAPYYVFTTLNEGSITKTSHHQ